MATPHFVNHRQHAGYWPFDVLSYDVTAYPSYYPFQGDQTTLTKMWWQMTQMQVQVSIHFERDWTITAGGGTEEFKIEEGSGDFSYNETVAVVPSTVTVTPQRANVTSMTPIYYGLNFDTTPNTTDPTFALNYTDSGTPGTTSYDYRPTFAMGLMARGVAIDNTFGPLTDLASQVVVFPDPPYPSESSMNQYWPSFIFTAYGAAVSGSNFPVQGVPADFAPAIVFSTALPVPAPDTSGGSPTDPDYEIGIPFATVGTLTLNTDGAPYTCPIYGYSGALSFGPGAPGYSEGATWSGFDNLAVSVILTPVYPT